MAPLDALTVSEYGKLFIISYPSAHLAVNNLSEDNRIHREEN